MQTKKIIVVGGGASGLMAAGVAAQCGAEVTLYEKMKTPARKIRISGKGRCNLSNSADLSEFLAHFGKSGRFLRQSFDRFFTPDLVEFFESQGLALKVERGGRIFPAEGDAPAVARLLIDWVEKSGVQVRAGAAVTGLILDEDQIAGVMLNKKKVYGDAVILATGGASYPRTGSTGDGYRIAETIGHSIVPTRPALVPLHAQALLVKRLAGLDLKNITCRLYVDGKRKRQEFGDLSFIPSGLSGPIVLTISLMAVDALVENRKVTVSLDFKPALDDAKLDARLLRDLQKRFSEPMDSVLRGLLPQQLVSICLEDNDIDPKEVAGKLSSRARKKIKTWLKDFRIEITGFGSLDEAIVTAGGVKTTEVDPRTMESKQIKSLYIVGELLDIQADTGGYNLQAAFSTGWLAGQAAAK